MLQLCFLMQLFIYIKKSNYSSNYIQLVVNIRAGEYCYKTWSQIQLNQLYLLDIVMGKKNCSASWVYAKSMKSCSEHSEFPQDCSNPLITSSSFYAIPESNGMRKRRKLQKKSLIVFPVEPETDEVIIDIGKSGPVRPPNIEDGINDGVQDCVISAEKCNKETGSIYESIDRENSFSLVKLEKGIDPEIKRTEAISAVECPISELVLSGEDLPIRDLCISVLRSHGLLVEDQSMSSSASTKIPGNNKGSSIFRFCELCSNLDDTLNMLLCDHCEEAFHVSCCYPKTKMLPADEWFCKFCSKLYGKVSRETSFLKSQDISWWNGIPKLKLDPIAFMLKYPEPYTSRVRIGDSFQAAVPEWPDRLSKDFDCIGEPLEMDLAETIGLHGCPTDKYPKPNSISNWLQCREVIYACEGERADGTVCGKWRRAPLSEVQTDDWDCSCSVLWDPSHSDCAVPQELETNEVLLQLKYIEQLRSRLAAKKSEFRS